MHRCGADKVEEGEYAPAALPRFQATGAHPISAQLFGSDPETMAVAAKVCEDLGFDILDINFGCPVNKVVKCNGGSRLCCADLRWWKRCFVPFGARFNPVYVQIPRRLER